MRPKPYCPTHRAWVDPVYFRGQEGRMFRLSDLYACHTTEMDTHFFTNPNLHIPSDRRYPAYQERELATDAPASA